MAATGLVEVSVKHMTGNARPSGCERRAWGLQLVMRFRNELFAGRGSNKKSLDERHGRHLLLAGCIISL